MQPDTSKSPDSSEDPLELLQQAFALYTHRDFEKALDVLVWAEHFALTARKPEILIPIYSMAGSVFSDLEDFERSMRYFEKSLQVIKLFEADDDAEGNADPVLTEWSASNEDKIGKLFFRLGQTGEAEIRFNQALGLYEKLLVADPENTQYLSSLARVKDNMGNLLSSRGQTDEACVVYTAAADIRRNLRKSGSEE